MSYARNDHLGGQEYDRLRDLARQEQGQHQHFAAKAKHAYSSGDGSGAHQFSEQSKQHAAAADNYNRQASEFIFRENNAVGRVAGDTIDLHGQYVEEAEEILEQRIRYAQQTGQDHLHVIVGKGNHSPGHIQKIKPKVEQICRELGLQYNTEHNEGRMYIHLQPPSAGGGGVQPVQMPAYDYQQHQQPQHQNYGQPHYQTAYPMGGAPNYSYAQAAGGGYPGAQQHGQMQYGGQNGGYQGQPQQQMQQEQQEQDNGIKCCGIKICVVM
ncbi:Uu.00g064330.m01.CDS01 [Anthostomella pinea]|uniref:Uu.00g064330.m01.CDS01 n=1 Tax=Anthostomella pinea TaxID=933095 RepID=A0AAI8VTK2_9PEZI|nr:Uu.00g064330.m01.CDS01 [Anthostomella pinea]